MTRKAVSAIVLALVLAAASYAQSKPNFSGTWKLSTTKSDFGMLPGPETRTDTIDHSDPSLKVGVSAEGAQGKQNFTANYTTDGKENVNKLGPIEAKSVLAWQGPALVITSKLNVQGNDVDVKSTWTISEDGKVMTQNVHLASAMGETDQKLVFEKQSGDAMAKATEAPKAIAKPTAPMSSGPHPNFSGVWKLIVAKSDFGVLPAPESRVDTIEHSEPALKLSRNENGPEGKRDYTLNMTTDGKAVVNSLGGNDATITSVWEGGTLVSTFKLKFQDQDVTIKRSSMLSDDGKTLTANSHLVSAMGELDQKEIYEKQ